MNPAPLETLHKRIKAARAADAIRRFEYRQRNLARGVWFRLRRLLSRAATAWQVGEEDARRLLDEGIRAQGVGLEIEPPIQILVVSEERIQTLATRRPLAIRLSAELLTTRHLALVLWPQEEADDVGG